MSYKVLLHMLHTISGWRVASQMTWTIKTLENFAANLNSTLSHLFFNFGLVNFKQWVWGRTNRLFLEQQFMTYMQIT